MIPSPGRMVTVVGFPSNGIEEQPAVITRVWANRSTAGGPVGVNLTVFPDLGAPTVKSSVMLYHDRKAAEAWLETQRPNRPLVAYWPDRV